MIEHFMFHSVILKRYRTKKVTSFSEPSFKLFLKYQQIETWALLGSIWAETAPAL